MKKILRLLLLAMMITMMMSCSSKKNEQEETLADMTVLLDWSPNTNHTGLYVAQQKGYYQNEGLHVSIAQPSDGGTEMLVASGKAQIGVSFQDSLVPAFSGDNQIPVTAIAALIQHNTSGLLSLKSKGIDRPLKLENCKYATWDMDIEKAMIKNIMVADGGDFSKLELIPSTVADAVSAIQSNVDCVWVYYAWDKIRADIAGVETNFIDFKDYGDELDYYNPVLIAGNDFLENHPEQAKAFLRATEKGYQYAIEHPDEAATILVESVPELDKTLVTKSQEWLSDQYQAEVPHWGEFDPDRWNGFYHWLYTQKLIDTPIPEGTGFTNDYLPLD